MKLYLVSTSNENTVPQNSPSSNITPIPQIIHVLPMNECFEEQTETTLTTNENTVSEDSPSSNIRPISQRNNVVQLNVFEFMNETIESNNLANINENQVSVRSAYSVSTITNTIRICLALLDVLFLQHFFLQFHTIFSLLTQLMILTVRSYLLMYQFFVYQ